MDKGGEDRIGGPHRAVLHVNSQRTQPRAATPQPRPPSRQRNAPLVALQELRVRGEAHLTQVVGRVPTHVPIARNGWVDVGKGLHHTEGAKKPEREQ